MRRLCTVISDKYLKFRVFKRTAAQRAYNKKRSTSKHKTKECTCHLVI